jgi:hypothetical protein
MICLSGRFDLGLKIHLWMLSETGFAFKLAFFSPTGQISKGDW